MIKMILILICCVLLAGCVTPHEAFRVCMGTSVKELEDGRKTAYINIMDYDCKTCYQKTEALLCKMPHVSIYAKTSNMIAVFLINPNTTPVGVFFTPIDANRTQVEVSSPSRSAKEWIARNVFAGELVGIKKAKK